VKDDYLRKMLTAAHQLLPTNWTCSRAAQRNAIPSGLWLAAETLYWIYCDKLSAQKRR